MNDNLAVQSDRFRRSRRRRSSTADGRRRHLLRPAGRADGAARRTAAGARHHGRRSRRDHAPERARSSPSPTTRCCASAAVVVPMNVLLKRREVGFYLSDPEASLLIAWHGFADAARDGSRRRRRRLPDGDPGRVRARTGGRRADRRGGAARGRRHGRDPLHVGNDRHPEGRRADPLQPQAQRRRVDRAVHDRRGRRHPRRAAAVSRVRPDVRAEHRDRRGRLPDVDPAVRSGQGAGDHRA